MISYLDWSGDQTNGLVFPSAGDNSESLNIHVLLPSRSLKLGNIISGYNTCSWVYRPYDWNFHLQYVFKEDEITKNSHVSFWGSDTLNTLVNKQLFLFIGYNLKIVYLCRFAHVALDLLTLLDKVLVSGFNVPLRISDQTMVLFGYQMPSINSSKCFSATVCFYFVTLYSFLSR